MKGLLLVGLVAGLAGVLLGGLLVNPSSCCQTVQGGVRDRLNDRVPGLGNVLEQLGLTKFLVGPAGWLSGGA